MLRLSQKRLFLLSALGVMLLAGWLYWGTLRLPLFYDTLLHIRLAGDLTWGSVWLPNEAFGFYRPMVFFPMMVLQWLFDGYPAWLLQGSNVVQHMANTGLLAWLGWRLWADWRRAAAAGAIFAVIPFSYRVLVIYGNNVYLAITGLMLLGLHGYLTAVSRPNPRKWWLFTWLLFVLMVLKHETAVLFGPFAALVHLNQQTEAPGQWRQMVQHKEWHKLLRLPWLQFIFAGLFYLIIYQFFPINPVPLVDTANNSLWLNLLYLLQAAVFPLVWFAHLLPGVSGALVTLVSGGLAMAATLWLAWQRPTWRGPLLLAWGWWAGASALVGLTLPTDYLLRGPRLLYLGGVGVALLWAHLLAGIWSGRKQTGGRVRVVLGTAVLLFILITSGQFVQTKLGEYRQLTQVVPLMQAELREAPDVTTSEILLVNLPQWLDVPPNTYAIGVEFVTMLGDYLFIEELVVANLPQAHDHAVWAVALPELQASQTYAYGVQAQHEWPDVPPEQTRHVFITYFAPDGLQTRHTGYLYPLTGSPIASPNPIAQFDDYLLTETTAEFCAGAVEVMLNWLPARRTIPDTTSVFVQVLAADGRLLAQADGPPLGVRPGLLAAATDTLLVDLREIKLNEGETAHTMLVGVYDFATDTRSPATDATGQPLPDNAWRFSITDCP